MKSRIWTCVTSMTLFAVLAIPVRLAAQEIKPEKPNHHRYKLVNLGTFGGPVGYLNWPGAQVLTNRRTVVGAADTSTPNRNYPNSCLVCPPDPFVFHAFRWQKSVLTDLGALPGVNNSFANWISANGLIAGFSQNGVIDPLLGIPEVDAVLWKDGEIINLGTLEGGYESAAFAVNNRGQVVGAALNRIPDPFGLGTQARAFLWQNGTMRDLGTLGGNDANALFVNERGQIAGWALTNSTPNPVTNFPTQDPFLWENGKMRDLGTLGGTLGFPTAFNNRGQVVGQSNLTGDLTFHPFLWEREVLTDLGTFGGETGTSNAINDAGEVVGKADLPGPLPQTHDAFLWRQAVMTDLGRLYSDQCSNAVSINSKSQVVGCSSDCTNCLHPFLWEDGAPMIDLNTFVPPDLDVQLTFAVSINDRGEIACFGKPPGAPPRDGDSQAPVFLLIPCEGEHSDDEGCADGAESTTTARSAPYVQTSTTARRRSVPTSELPDRIHSRFGRNRGFTPWLPK